MALLGRHMYSAYLPLLADAGAHDLVKESHCLRIYKSEDQWRAEVLATELRRRAGIDLAEVSKEELRALEPNVAGDFTFAIKVAKRRSVTNPGRLVEKFYDHLRAQGTEVVTGRVVGFERAGKTVQAAILEDSRTIKGGQFVIAAGAWSAQLTRQLGDRMPLESERGYHVMLPEASSLLNGTIVYPGRGLAMSRMEQGLRCSGVVELAGLTAPPDEWRREKLLQAACEVVPSLASHRATAGKLWLGHRPSMPDSLPVIDRARAFLNTFYAFGHGHMGLGWAAITGLLLSQLMRNEAPLMDLAPFRTNRFRLLSASGPD